MRTHTLAVGEEIVIDDIRLTVLSVEGEDVVFGLCPPDGTEVTCDPPEPALAATQAGG